MDDQLWIGMLDVRPGTEGAHGAYVYCAARADEAAAALVTISAAATARGFEIQAITWLSRFADLSESQQESEAVAGVVATLGDEAAALDHFFTYPEADEHLAARELKDEVEEFVAGWIDGAVEALGPFTLGDFAFVAEMEFPGVDAPEVGWAFRGEVDRAPDFFARAIELAASDDN
jgi:hypothetical protein